MSENDKRKFRILNAQTQTLEEKAVANKSKVTIDNNGFISMDLNSRETRIEIRRQLNKLKELAV